jgi:hypothetical protein
MSGHHDEVDRVLGGVAHDLRRRRPDLAARRGVPPEAIRLIKHGAEAPADAALLPSRHIGRCARVCGHVQQMQRRAHASASIRPSASTRSVDGSKVIGTRILCTASIVDVLSSASPGSNSRACWPRRPGGR